MATAVAQTPQAATASAPAVVHPQPAQVPQTTFAQRCVEDMSTLNPTKSQKYAVYFQVASIVVPIAILAIAGVAVFFAIHALIPTLAAVETASVGVQLATLGLSSVAIGSLCFGTTLSAALSYLFIKAKSDLNRANVEKGEKLLTEYRQVQPLSHGALSASLRALQVPRHAAPEETELYRVLLANYNLNARSLEDEESKLRRRLEAAQRIYLLASGTGEEAPFAEYQLYFRRWGALNQQDVVLRQKLRTAFLLAVMQRPDYSGTRKGLYRVSQSPLAFQQLYAAFNDPRQAQYVTFSAERPVLPLSMQQVKEMPTHAIAARMVQAMPRA